MPLLEYLGRRCTGSRVRFCTDSPKITIKMKLKSVKEDINIPASGSAGVDVYYGMGKDSVYGGYIAGQKEIKAFVYDYDHNTPISSSNYDVQTRHGSIYQRDTGLKRCGIPDLPEGKGKGR